MANILKQVVTQIGNEEIPQRIIVQYLDDVTNDFHQILEKHSKDMQYHDLVFVPHR